MVFKVRAPCQRLANEAESQVDSAASLTSTHVHAVADFLGENVETGQGSNQTGGFSFISLEISYANFMQISSCFVG